MKDKNSVSDISDNIGYLDNCLERFEVKVSRMRNQLQTAAFSIVIVFSYDGPQTNRNKIQALFIHQRVYCVQYFGHMGQGIFEQRTVSAICICAVHNKAETFSSSLRCSEI